jgi:hypothetical protein
VIDRHGGLRVLRVHHKARIPFDIRLQTVGPGEYEAPGISSPAVRFTGVSLVPPFVPAGPTQVFRFQALNPGRATLTFHHSGMSPDVSDTVVVH